MIDISSMTFIRSSHCNSKDEDFLNIICLTVKIMSHVKL